MPKAVLEFQLPEEQADFELAVAAIDYACAWDDLFNFVRHKLKYESDSLSEDECKAYESVKAKIVEIEQERKLPELT